MRDDCNSDSQRRGSVFVAPKTPVERAVAAIWSELLQVEPVGAEDNFLLLGGESLLAAQAASRIRSQFGCEVHIRTVLIGTVEQVASEICALTVSQ